MRKNQNNGQLHELVGIFPTFFVFIMDFNRILGKRWKYVAINAYKSDAFVS